MTTILIVLVLLAAAVGIVVWATRRKPDQTSNAPHESDTGWNDPVTPAETLPTEADVRKDPLP
jgi:hypothetical protein